MSESDNRGIPDGDPFGTEPAWRDPSDAQDGEVPRSGDDGPAAEGDEPTAPLVPPYPAPAAPAHEANPAHEQSPVYDANPAYDQSPAYAGYPPVPPPYPVSYPVPASSPPTSGFESGYGTYAPYPHPYGTPAPGAHLAGAHQSGRTSRVPGWLWPVIAVVSLVLGLLGGAIGGALVANQENGAGVLQVERRTAAPLPGDNTSVPSVAQKVLPSTVRIVVAVEGRSRGSSGSGWVFDDEGHVITNSHVIADAATTDATIDVIDHEGGHHEAEIVGRSAVYDLAVLKVEGIEDLPSAALGSAVQMNVGETVVAIGSPLALSASVTSGIISAVDRPVSTGVGNEASFINAIQTDAAINPGNSGGPLANLQGEIIGVNSALATLGSSSDEGTNIGIGFAIPIEQVLVTADQILRTGRAQYPVIGVNVKGTTGDRGAEVTEITEGTPASSSDLRVGDVIVAVDGRAVTDQTDLVVAIRTHTPSETVTLSVLRDGRTLEIDTGLVARTG